MTDKRLRIAGSPLIGVFARCTENVVVVPRESDDRSRESLAEGLKVRVVAASIGGSSVVGSLIAANSKGFLVSGFASQEEMDALSPFGKVGRLPGKISAAGNVILANDQAALVHPGISERASQRITEILGVDILRGTIGGLKTVGMSAVATNQGILSHPRVSDEEVSILEDLFGLPVDVGTVNFGTPQVGSGLLANSHGYVAGSETSGPELGRIEDALGFMG